MDRIIASRTLTKVLADGRYVIAKCKLDHIEGNAHPYFSLTGEEWETARHYQRRTVRETGLLRMGAMGDDLVGMFPEYPELALLNALHLADDDGTPMHAKANGWYYYSGKAHEYERTSPYYPDDPKDTPHERAAHTLRVTPEELPEGMTKEEFEQFVDGLADRWREEAAKVRAWLDAA